MFNLKTGIFKELQRKLEYDQRSRESGDKYLTQES